LILSRPVDPKSEMRRLKLPAALFLERENTR
jgi:hypothetical protein